MYYASVLSIVSQMRTNLPLMYKKVWPTSQGSAEAIREGGVMIGGAISYFWCDALTFLSRVFYRCFADFRSHLGMKRCHRQCSACWSR